MKIKLKNAVFENIKYTYSIFKNDCKLINILYNNEEINFQTPKVIIKKIMRENDKEYLLLQLVGNEACKTFYSKIIELENYYNKITQDNTDWFNDSIPITGIKSVFTNDTFIVKIPFKYSKPSIKLYTSDNNLFNYYHLKPGMEIICLLGSNNLWISQDNSLSYNLIVKEILVSKLI